MGRPVSTIILLQKYTMTLPWPRIVVGHAEVEPMKLTSLVRCQRATTGTGTSFEEILLLFKFMSPYNDANV